MANEQLRHAEAKIDSIASISAAMAFGHVDADRAAVASLAGLADSAGANLRRARTELAP